MNDELEQVQKLTGNAMREVFQSMVSMELTPEEPSMPANDPEGQIIGSVGFIGETSGVICIYMGDSFAKNATSRMLGISESEVDEEGMVNDAVGEISNMVAGYVKSRLCDRGWHCVLTIPSIVRGRQLSVDSSAPNITRKVLGFRNDKFHLMTELLLKQPNG